MESPAQTLISPDGQLEIILQAMSFVEMFPTGERVASFAETFSEAVRSGARIHTRADHDKHFDKWFKDLREEYPDLAKAITPPGDDYSADEYQAHVIECFDQLSRIRDFVEMLADKAEEFRDVKPGPIPFPIYIHLPAAYFADKTGDEEKDGKLRLRIEPVALALNGADLSKILRCENCSQVFWQTRRDKKTCSRRCSNALAQRAHQKQLRRNPNGYL